MVTKDASLLDTMIRGEIMPYGIIKNSICENVIEIDIYNIPVFLKYEELIEVEPGFGIGDFYINGKWSKTTTSFTQQELRKQSYETLNCITWESEEITVDEANKLFLNYFAENNPKANEIQPLIIEAKEHIRTLYPDSEE